MIKNFLANNYAAFLLGAFAASASLFNFGFSSVESAFFCLIWFAAIWAIEYKFRSLTEQIHSLKEEIRKIKTGEL